MSWDMQPEEMAEQQRLRAIEYYLGVKGGQGVRFPWHALDQLTGPVLPGFLVMVGGRKKGGKTTFLLNWAEYLTLCKRTFLYITTETEPESLKIKLAAQSLDLDVGAAIAGELSEEDEARLFVQFAEQSSQGGTSIYAPGGGGTLTELQHWFVYAAEMGVDCIIYDYFQRMATEGDTWQGLANNLKQIKNMARDFGIPIVMGAQLHAKDKGVVAPFEMPGDGEWYGGQSPGMEADFTLQLWRPMRDGVSEDEIRKARRNEIDVMDLVQTNVMQIRISDHRWRGANMYKTCKLTVNNDRVSDHIGIVA